MKVSFSFAGYGILAATAVWTLGWIAATVLAADRVDQSHDIASFVALAVTMIFGSIGMWITFQMWTLREPAESNTSTPKEPWFRQITGWIAAIFWCGGAVAWNFGIIGWQLRMAHDGRGWSMLILIPWSLIGWFLMGVLFVGLGVVMDSIIGFLRGA